MISTLGILSIIVLAVSVFFLILHYKLMKKRVPMDDSLTELDFLLYNSMQESNEITPEITEAIRLANRKIDAYNAHIQRFPVNIVAYVLGFSAEETR